jgi:hypothetical protein
MAMSYGNNLVYIVCFYLTTMGLALAKITNDHVDKVFIDNVYTREIFAEEDQILFVTIRNTSMQKLKEIEIRISRQKYIAKVNLNPQEIQTIEILWTPEKRGQQKIPTVRVQTSYPAGLFAAWKILKSTENIIVFPTRRGLKNFPDTGFISQDSIGILKEIRDYQPGDSPKRIHWRSMAKIGQLRTLIHEGNESPVCQFNLDQVQNLSTESKLEQLTLWITLAESNGIPWMLNLKEKEFNSQNMNAKKMALTHLANWGKQ